MKTYELQPSEFDRHKSFYHKARIEENMYGTKFLYSYETLVAYIKKGTLYKASSAWSRTTARHIKSFSDRYATNNPYLGKHDWDKREIPAFL